MANDQIQNEDEDGKRDATPVGRLRVYRRYLGDTDGAGEYEVCADYTEDRDLPEGTHKLYAVTDINRLTVERESARDKFAFENGRYKDAEQRVKAADAREQQQRERAERAEAMARRFFQTLEKERHGRLQGGADGMRDWCFDMDAAPRNTLRPFWLSNGSSMRLGYWDRECWIDFALAEQHPRASTQLGFEPTCWQYAPSLPEVFEEKAGSHKRGFSHDA